MGFLDRARPHLEQALVLERGQVLVGEGLPRALLEWARLQFDSGSPVDARASIEEALPTLRARLGEDHMQVTETINRMGAVAFKNRLYRDAEVHLREALERYQKLPAHPQEGLVGCMSNLANLLWSTRRGDEADPLQRSAVGLAREVLPRNHPTLSSVLVNLAAMREQERAYQEAAALLQEALECAERGGRDGEVRMQRARIAQVEEKLKGEGREE